MANGGKRPGAGRPKGSTNRPQIRAYFTPEEIAETLAFYRYVPSSAEIHHRHMQAA